LNSKPTLIEFLRRLVGDTTSLISGGLSVPLTAMSLFSNNKYAKVSFGALAVTGFLFASYCLWAGERRNTLAVQVTHISNESSAARNILNDARNVLFESTQEPSEAPDHDDAVKERAVTASKGSKSKKNK
jgi:hypothetical protein